jgi:antitoxin component YwqK of YwqJK toxin-antitoxin module
MNNEIKNGLIKTYYKNGKLEVECEYKNNVKEGIYKYYYENGQLNRKYKR